MPRRSNFTRIRRRKKRLNEGIDKEPDCFRPSEIEGEEHDHQESLTAIFSSDSRHEETVDDNESIDSLSSDSTQNAKEFEDEHVVQSAELSLEEGLWEIVAAQEFHGLLLTFLAH